MTPIKKAMCAVIRESGGWPFMPIGVIYIKVSTALKRCAKSNVTFGTVIDNKMWQVIKSITLDGHTLTQQEYEEWEKQLK